MAVATKKIPYAKLKGLRAEHGISMERMAKITGISLSAYISREAGKREFKVSEAKAISKFFKMSMDDIFFS